jgi:hypothetical protein
MKYLKMLGLAAVAAGAMMAFVGAGTASATELTCSAGVMCAAPTHIHAVNEGTVTLDPIFGSITCTESTVTGRASTGSSSTTVVSVNERGEAAELEALTFGGCNATITVEKKGSLEIHTRTANADNNGTLTSKNAQIKIVFSGITCTATTAATGTDIGTVTGSSTTSSTATLDIEATIPLDGAFCGGSAQWTGNYKVTTPDFLNID